MKSFYDAIKNCNCRFTVFNVPIRIYNPEKTLADCFKFRNKIGMEVVLEAPRLYKAREKFKTDEIFKYVKTCRVENIMRPYLEMSV